jgi:hypothetical protein
MCFDWARALHPNQLSQVFQCGFNGLKVKPLGGFAAKVIEDEAARVIGSRRSVEAKPLLGLQFSTARLSALQ